MMLQLLGCLVLMAGAGLAQKQADVAARKSLDAFLTEFDSDLGDGVIAAFVDLNGDGKDDALIVSGTTLTPILSVGDGTFTAVPGFSISPVDFPYRPLVGDFNEEEDGRAVCTVAFGPFPSEQEATQAAADLRASDGVDARVVPYPGFSR